MAFTSIRETTHYNINYCTRCYRRNIRGAGEAIMKEDCGYSIDDKLCHLCRHLEAAKDIVGKTLQNRSGRKVTFLDYQVIVNEVDRPPHVMMSLRYSDGTRGGSQKTPIPPHEEAVTMHYVLSRFFKDEALLWEMVTDA